MLSGANSTAIVFVALITAAFEALYHVKPGRGLMPAVEAIDTNEPPLPCFCIYGTITFAE